jgi:hypothetical protein
VSLSREELQTGFGYLKMFLKKVEIEVSGGTVIVKQVLDLGDPNLAKSFAEALKKTYEEGI